MRASTLSIDLSSLRARTAINRTDLSKPVAQAIGTVDLTVFPARSRRA